MTNSTPRELALVEAALMAAAEQAKKLQCRDEFEPSFHDKMLKIAEDKIRSLDPATIIASVPQPAEQPEDENCGFVAVKNSAIDWLKKHYPSLCERSGLCERVGGRLYTITRLDSFRRDALTQAPQQVELTDELRNMMGAHLLGDFVVQVEFKSCRAASAFQRALLSASKG